MKRITLKTVAEEAGVSCSTVSFVINQNRPISDEVKKRVHVAIKKLNYVPNEAARMLSSHKKTVLGVLVNNCVEDATGTMLEAINEVVLKYGYRMHLNIVPPGYDSARKAMQEMAANGFLAGIINMLPEISAVETMKLCGRLPAVTFLRQTILSPVYFDYAYGITLAMEHLWQLGHRKIGFIGGKNNCADTETEHRLTGYRQFWIGQKMSVPEEFIEISGGSTEEGIRFSGMLYERGITAVVCGNDYIAAGALYWANANKIEVPSQLSVVGYDDSRVATMIYPPLTSVHLPIREIAELTVKGLVDRINGHDQSGNQICKPQLVIRNSTGPIK